MQLITEYKKLIYSLPLLGILWISFLLFRMILIDEGNDQLKYIPKNATVVLKINSKEMLISSVNSVIFQSKDNEIIQLLRDLIEKKTLKEGVQKNPGIDFSKDLIYFTVPVSNGSVGGYLFQLNSQRIFLKNIKEYLNDNMAYAANENVGIILFDKSEKFGYQLTTEELNILAYRFIKEQSDFNLEKHFQHTGKPDTFFELWSNHGVFANANYVTQSDISGTINANSVHLNGFLSLNVRKINTEDSIYGLVPNGFHFHSRLVSEVIDDSLLALVGVTGTIPELSSVSINYFGSEVINEGYFGILPNCDLLVEFNENYSIDELLNNLEENKWVRDLETTGYHYAGFQIYLKQLNDRTIYIGRHPFYASAVERRNELMRIEGDVNALTRIDGEGFRMKLLTIVPLYSASTNLTNSLNRIEISLIPNEKNRAELNGVISFKDNHFALNELLRFGLQAQFFK